MTLAAPIFEKNRLDASKLAPFPIESINSISIMDDDPFDFFNDILDDIAGLADVPTEPKEEPPTPPIEVPHLEKPKASEEPAKKKQGQKSKVKTPLQTDIDDLMNDLVKSPLQTDIDDLMNDLELYAKPITGE